MNNLKYKFALDKFKNVVNISEAKKGVTYFFGNTDIELIVKDGGTNRKHYSLKSGGNINSLGGIGGESIEHYNEKWQIKSQGFFYWKGVKIKPHRIEVEHYFKDIKKKSDVVFFDEDNIMCIIEVYHTNKKTEADIEKFNQLNTTVYEYNINNGETELLCWSTFSRDVRKSEEKKLELWYENTIRRKSERIKLDIKRESESAESLRDKLKELSEFIERDSRRGDIIKDKRKGIETNIRKSSKRSRDVREETDRLRTSVGRVERQISDIGKEIKWTEGAVEKTKPDKSIYEEPDIKAVKSRIKSYQELIRELETEEVILAIDEMIVFFKEADIPNTFTLSPCETITNLPKFIKSHIRAVKSNPGNMTYLPYFSRLEKVYNNLK